MRILTASLISLFAACNQDPLSPPGAPDAQMAPAGCAKDTDCKLDRICVNGACVEPGVQAQPDLASANGACATWKGFANRVDYPTATDPQAIAIGDLNGDRRAEIAVTTLFGGLNVLKNLGPGTFAAHMDYGVGKGTSIAIADFDGSGAPDVVFVNKGGMANYGGTDSVSVLLNQGGGALGAAKDFATGGGPRALAVADFDGDGKPDLAVANLDDGTVGILLNKGGGAFSAQVTYAVGFWLWAVAAGDLDGDGKPDLAVANYGNMGGAGTVRVLLNQGKGTFGTHKEYATGRQPVSVAMGDLNGDGRLDLAVANTGSDSVSVLLNQGGGQFTGHGEVGVGTNPSAVIVGDWNGDGNLDLAAANQDNATGNPSTVSVMLNQGAAMFATRMDLPVDRGPSALASGDLNGDGALDLAVVNDSSSSVSVLLNLGCN